MKNAIKAWFFVFRPWSYAATLVPFLVGAAVAPATHGAWRWWTGLAAGILFQSTVNLLNTWGDERSGVDDVPGAIRTTPQVHEGLISLNAVLATAAVCAAAASVLGSLLCFYPDGDGWSVSWCLLAVGITGLLGATNYSTGVKFKYLGLGVPFVAFLMGPLEIAAAVCILRPEDGASFLTARNALLSLPVASLVCVILHGNDMRDIATDRAAGIRSCAIFLGPKGALTFYWICHLLPYAVCAALLCSHGRLMLLPFMALPLTRRTLASASKTYASNPSNPPWMRLEKSSGAIHLAFGILYALALARAL